MCLLICYVNSSASSVWTEAGLRYRTVNRGDGGPSSKLRPNVNNKENKVRIHFLSRRVRRPSDPPGARPDVLLVRDILPEPGACSPR